jgi:hypothetical protein
MSSVARGQESINLVWAASPDPDVTRYSIYYGVVGGVSTNTIQVGNSTNTTLTGLSAGNTYFVYATAVNSVGAESDPSNIINYSVKSGPVLGAVADQTIPENTLFSLQFKATDPDPTVQLVYTLISGPSGASIDPATGLLTWTPTEAQGPSSNSVTVQVSESGSTVWTDTTTFNIFVQEVNQPPTIAPIADQTIPELSPFTLRVNATDPDIPANTLSYSLLNAPAGLSIDPGTGTLTWTPSEAQGPSSNTVVVQVTDNGVPPLSSQVSFNIKVTEVNRAPVLAPIANQSVPELTTLSLTLSATDSDIPANVITYSLVSGPAGASVDPVTGTFTWTPTEAQGPSTTLITVAATDNGVPALSDTKSFTVVVSEVNSAPVLAAIPDQKVNPGQVLMLVMSATDSDIPANNLTYRLKAGLPGASLDSTTGVLTWRVPKTQAPGNYLVTVTVVDDGIPQMGDTKTFTISVNPKNQKNSQLMGVGGPSHALTWVAELEPSRLITFQQALNDNETTAPATYYLEYSSDLHHWTRLGELAESTEVRVAAANDAHLEFYRVISPGTAESLQNPILSSVSFDP